MTELATVDADYFRPNFFVNTPDILTGYLADGGRPAFEARLVLAATLSPSYGIYSGYENVENVPVRPGSEEYLDSEKYELKKRTIEGPLLPLIQRLNEIRRANRSLQRIDNVTFLETANDHLIAYAKQDDADTVIVCVNLDPAAAAEGLLDGAAGSRPAGVVRSAGSAHRRDLRLAGRRQLRPPPARRRPRHARPDEPDDPIPRQPAARSPTPPSPDPSPPRPGTGSYQTAQWFEADPLWFKRAVFYEIHIRGFADGNDDGTGDLRGLTEKLDYLQWLGVDCIWLLPMYPSPLRDGGYDIADFYSIHPDYGTVEDFRALIDAAHERGIRVIADLVMNHTSSDHPWFQEARQDPSSPKRDWYVWSDTDHALPRGADHLHRHRGLELDVGSGRRPVLLAPLLLAPARPELRQPRGAGRRCSTSCASGSTSGSTASGSTRCRTSSSATGRTARTCPRRTPT